MNYREKIGVVLMILFSSFVTNENEAVALTAYLLSLLGVALFLYGDKK